MLFCPTKKAGVTVLNTALFLVPLLIAVREIECQSFQLISVCGTELIATPISHRPNPFLKFS